MSTPTSPWTARIQKEAIKLYASGLSARAVSVEIQNRHGRQPAVKTILRWVGAAGITRNGSQALTLRHWRGRDEASALARARSLICERFYSQRRAAAAVGMSPTTLQIKLDLHENLSAARRKLWWLADLPEVHERVQRKELVVQLRREGEEISEIARLTGLSRSTIWSYLHEAKLTRRVGGGAR